jgi:hypothetical protein
VEIWIHGKVGNSEEALENLANLWILFGSSGVGNSGDKGRWSIHLVNQAHHGGDFLF